MPPVLFLPGEEYGRECRFVIWVCQNQVKRSFAQCDPQVSQDVYQSLLGLIAQLGLSHVASVFQSGCMMGCAEQGTTVAITVWGDDRHSHTGFYKNVSPEDLPALLNTALASSPA